MSLSSISRRFAIVAATTLVIHSTAPNLSALPDGCYSTCYWHLLNALDACQDYANDSFCVNDANSAYARCLDGCNGPGWQPTMTQFINSYQGAALMAVSAGRKVGSAFLSGQGTVTQVSFSLLDLDAIPSMPDCTSLDSLPWEALGAGTFDGSQFWTIQVDMAAHVAARGFIIRVDFEDSTLNSTLLGAAIAPRIDAQSSGWANLGGALQGGAGSCPKLAGTGSLASGSLDQIALSNAAPASLCALFLSTTSNPVPFMGGTLQAFPLLGSPLFLATGGSVGQPGTGGFTLPIVVPANLPSGLTVYFQSGIADPGAPAGIALSNAVRATFP